MTLQKSLKNNINLNDFKRSLLGSVTFPAIALVVLFFSVAAPVIDWVTSDEFKATAIHNEVQMFMSEYAPIEASLLFMGMVLCGILTAVMSFYFLLSKKQVNVYLSQGITRTTMFLNRVASGVIMLFISTLIPILIVYIINIDKFGISAQLTSTFLYFVAGLFVSGLVGFSMGAFVMMITGNVFETGLNIAAISIFPIIVYNVWGGIRDLYLKGYCYDYSAQRLDNALLVPFLFMNTYKHSYGDDYMTSLNTHQLFQPITKDMLVNGKIPELYKIDSTFIMPVIVWFVISLVLLALAGVLLNKRKAEHANSFGHFSISRAICATTVFFVAIYLSLDTVYMYLPFVNAFGSAVIGSVVGFIAFFLIQLIMSRKIKAFVKAIPVCAVLVFVTVLGFVTADTGIFGQYNKTPEKENIESVAITFSELPVSQNDIHSNLEYVKSTNAKDIDTIIKLFNAIKKDKRQNGDWTAGVKFAITDKDGETKYRSFDVYSHDLYEMYMKEVCASDYFDAIVEEGLLGFSDKGVSANGKYYLNKVAKTDYYEYDMVIDGEDENFISTWRYTDNQMIETAGINAWSDLDTEMQRLYKGDDLAVALYNDIIKMTYEDLFKNTAKPIGTIATGNTGVCANVNDILKPSVNPYDKYHGGINIEESYYDGKVYYYIDGEQIENPDDIIMDYIVYSMFYVYPQMTHTIEYLEENYHGFDTQYKGKIKEVLYTDSAVSFNKACEKYAEVNESRFNVEIPIDYLIFETQWFIQDSFKYLMDFINEDTKYSDIFKSVYKTAGVSLTTVNNEKIDDVVEKCVPRYLIGNENGRYVYIIYENGTMICQYLPEANLNVVK